MPNVLSPRDVVSRPGNMDETVLSSSSDFLSLVAKDACNSAVLLAYFCTDIHGSGPSLLAFLQLDWFCVLLFSRIYNESPKQ